MAIRSFKKYLMESARTYSYRIKIAGTPDKNWVDMFCINLQKYDPVEISQPRSTPIQKDPYGFPGLENQSITIIDAKFKYPVIEPFIKQLARLLNYDENNVRLIQSNYDDSINGEEQQYQNQQEHSPLLNQAELADGGKQASKDYADQYLTNIMKGADKKEKFTVAGGNTPAAQDFRKMPGNQKSPMTAVNRPPLPATGARKG